MQDPVATYVENMFGRERRYALHAAHLYVSSTGFGETPREFVVPLNRLRPEYRRCRNPAPYFYWFVFITTLGLAGILLLAFATGNWINACSSVWAAMAVSLFVGGIVGAVATGRRFDVAVFETDGSCIRIVRAGPDDARFEPFVIDLVERARLHAGANV